MAKISTLKELEFLFKEDANFNNLTINDLKPEILKKKTFLPSDLNRGVVELSAVVSTNVEFDGHISSKFEAKNIQRGEPGILYSISSFLHFDKNNKSLYVFQDYDASGLPLENVKGRDNDNNTIFFSPDNLFDAYDNDLIKTYTDNH